MAWIALTHACGLAQGQPLLKAVLHGSATAFDGGGNLYIAGYATSDQPVPVTPGAFQTTFGPCEVDGCTRAYVTKISTDGKRILYATYIGGSGNDFPQAIAVDSSGSLYITGPTTSPDFPVTAGSYHPAPSAAFLTRLSPDGSKLLGSTYLDTDATYGIALDSPENAYVASCAATQNSVSCGAGAMMKFDSALHTQIYNRVLDDSLGVPSAIAVDRQGEGAGRRQPQAILGCQ